MGNDGSSNWCVTQSFTYEGINILTLSIQLDMQGLLEEAPRPSQRSTPDRSPRRQDVSTNLGDPSAAHFEEVGDYGDPLLFPFGAITEALTRAATAGSREHLGLGPVLADYVYRSLSIPYYGSAPEKWQRIGDVVSASVPTGAIVFGQSGLEGLGSGQVLFWVGSTLTWVYFGRPAITVTSYAFKRRLAKALKVDMKDIDKYSP